MITRGAIETPEQYIPGKPPEGPWETCFTKGTQWQCKPTNEKYKSGTKIIEMLIETRAKGGALLLNVGPMPGGRIPIEQEARLREVALWMAVNKKAIYNTRPWTVTNEGNIWFTKSKNTDTVYAFLTAIPDRERGTRRGFLLRSVSTSDNTEVNVLGQSGRVVEYMPDADAKSRLTQTNDGVSISVVRAQRHYNDHKWPNPVVVEISHVSSATNRPQDWHELANGSTLLLVDVNLLIDRYCSVAGVLCAIESRFGLDFDSWNILLKSQTMPGAANCRESPLAANGCSRDQGRTVLNVVRQGLVPSKIRRI